MDLYFFDYIILSRYLYIAKKLKDTCTSQTINNSLSVIIMTLSHKDWELPNSRIWLAKMDIDRGLDFPI